VFVTLLQMRNAEINQDQDESRGSNLPTTAPDRDREPPVPPSAADSRPVNANGRRLSRAEERHLREWAGTLVCGLAAQKLKSPFNHKFVGIAPFLVFAEPC
jgi:hypothetical protein